MRAIGTRKNGAMSVVEEIAPDRISISGVRVMASHGVFEHERQELHPFLADVSAHVSTKAAGRSDEVSATISYTDLAEDAYAVLAGPTVNLVETLAEQIAERVLARGALAVDVAISKPEAPIAREFADARVAIRRTHPILQPCPGRAIIALGANLGDREATLSWAVEQIRYLGAVEALSAFVPTAPLLAPGQEPQPPYLNGVLSLRTHLSPLELLRELQRIEISGGRVRHEHWGARTLDLDLVDITGVTSHFPELELPHPRASQRLFVLQPWAQIESGASLEGVPLERIIARLCEAS